MNTDQYTNLLTASVHRVRVGISHLRCDVSREFAASAVLHIKLLLAFGASCGTLNPEAWGWVSESSREAVTGSQGREPGLSARQAQSGG